MTKTRISQRLSTRLAMTAAVATAAGLSGVGAQAAVAAPASADSLTVVAAGPIIWPAGRPMSIHVVLHNPDGQMLCGDFVVSLAWWRPGGRVHTKDQAVANAAGVGAVDFRLDRKAMAAGQTRYYASVTQDCGLGSRTEYAGRSPANGFAAVTLVD